MTIAVNASVLTFTECFYLDQNNTTHIYIRYLYNVSHNEQDNVMTDRTGK